MQLHTGSPSPGLEGLEEEWDSYSVAGRAGTHRGDSIVVSDFFCAWHRLSVYTLVQPRAGYLPVDVCGLVGSFGLETAHKNCLLQKASTPGLEPSDEFPAALIRFPTIIHTFLKGTGLF